MSVHDCSIILQCMKRFRRPVTFDELVDYIAQSMDMSADKIRSSLKLSIDTALYLGLVAEYNGYYSVQTDVYLNMKDCLFLAILLRSIESVKNQRRREQSSSEEDDVKKF